MVFVFFKEGGVEGLDSSPPKPGTDDEGYHPEGGEEDDETQGGSSSSSGSDSGSDGE